MSRARSHQSPLSLPAEHMEFVTPAREVILMRNVFTDTSTPAVAAAGFAGRWQASVVMATQPLSRETRGPVTH